MVPNHGRDAHATPCPLQLYLRILRNWPFIIETDSSMVRPSVFRKVIR